jgi:hypothetical protein
MSAEDDLKRVLDDAHRFPTARNSAPRLTRVAMEMMLEGKVLSVDTLRVRLVDIEDDTATFEIEFCDKEGIPIVNVIRHTLMLNCSLTIAHMINCLTFTVSSGG